MNNTLTYLLRALLALEILAVGALPILFSYMIFSSAVPGFIVLAISGVALTSFLIWLKYFDKDLL